VEGRERAEIKIKKGYEGGRREANLHISAKHLSLKKQTTQEIAKNEFAKLN
jgi:hypothetical protein